MAEALRVENRRTRRHELAALALGVLVAALVGCGPKIPEPEAVASIAPPRAEPAQPVAAAEPPPEEAPSPRPDPAAAERDPGAELLRTCEQIAAKLSSVSLEDCTESRLELSAGRSVLGTPILVAEYPPLPEREPLGRVLLFGGIHGDELSSVSIVYTWLATLDRHHSGLFHWRVAPLLNPDGLLRQRSQRMNERGVDLNRNFPSPNWMVEAPEHWVRRTSRNPRRYPGEAPLSEPESRWLDEQIRTFRPAAIVAVHAPHHVVDYDGPPEPPERLGPLHLHLMGTYPGSLGRYAGLNLGLPVVTIELPSAGAVPSPDDRRRMWVDLVAWLKRSVPQHRTERLTRAATAEPAAAETAGMDR